MLGATDGAFDPEESPLSPNDQFRWRDLTYFPIAQVLAVSSEAEREKKEAKIKTAKLEDTIRYNEKVRV